MRRKLGWRRWQFPALHISTFIGILHLLIGILGAGIISAFSLYFIYRSGEQANLREIENLTFVVDNALETQGFYSPNDLNISRAEATINGYLKNRPGIRYAILQPDGRPLLLNADTSRALVDVSATSPEVQTALSNSIGQSIRKDGRGRLMILVATTINQGGHISAVLVLGAPLDQVLEPTYRTMRWLGVIALLIVAFTVMEGWLGSVYISRPLVRLSLVAEQLSQGNLDARAEAAGPVEVVHLARTLNEMSFRLQNSLNSLRAFVANASHELRTPLTTIKLQVGALRSGAFEEPDVAQHFMNQIDSEIDRLEHTVNDMLDLSQIEGGESRPKFMAMNLADLANEVQAFWETRASHSGLTLTVTAEEALPQVKGDPYQLRRLLDNLLDNAVKNTPAGGRVDIALRRCRPLEGNRLPDVVRLEVRDTGTGIPPEYLPHLFDRFFRVDQSRPRTGRPTGSGLGLAIARSIVNAHGGRIGVNSLIGSGSTFWVELPIY